MKAELVPIDSISLDPANLRRHPTRNLAAIVESLKRFGQQRPILVDAAGIVRAGNGTLMAAKQLGYKEIEIIRSGLKGSEATAYAIADNRTAELAEWETDALAQTLSALQMEDKELFEATGFDAKELDAMVLREIDEDEVPEPPADPITKPGDIWILGEHRVLCGDSTKAEDVARLMNGEKADLCFTSPPYNADTTAGDGDIFNRKPQKKLYGKEFDDKMSSSEYVKFAENALSLCFANTEGFIFWNVNYNARSRFEYIKQIVPWLEYLIEQVCWKKHSAIPLKGSMRRAWEPIYLFSTTKKPLGSESVESNFWDISNTKCQTEGHKACFPVALPAKAIEVSGNVALLYDPFLGSGTTLIAAEQLGRKCYGMEISPAYCDVIVKRWETLTGKKARLG
jgi:DNA modification methylase